MADFRKMLYALAVVALLAAFTVPASAQGLNCSAPVGVNAAVRQGGFTELAGDFTVSCDAEIPGASTPAGTAVKQGTLRIKVIGTTFTSKTVCTPSSCSTPTDFKESLLLVDNPEPGSKLGNIPPYYGQLPCGTNGNDNSINGPGVCNIISTGDPRQTYDGIPSASNTTSCLDSGGGASYGCGRPNIFQGRASGDQTTCPVATCVEFKAVPLDPPGTGLRRIFRFVNNRINAAALAIGGTVNFEISVVENQVAFGLPLTRQAQVAEVVGSAPTTSFGEANTSFVLCEKVREDAVASITITEGDASGTWRARNTIVQRVNSSDYNGNNFTNYNGGSSIPSGDDPQNDFRGYFTESGFVFGSISGGTSLSNGLGSAGVATQGTQVAFAISNPPAGVTIDWPSTVTLFNGTNQTGFMNLVSTSGNVVVYEIGHTNPFLVETATITPVISFFSISSGSFPFSMSAGSAILWPAGSSVNSSSMVSNFSTRYPRFAGSLGDPTAELFEIGTCTCNLLFPWVVSGGGWNTGIVVSNTSKDPTNAGLSPTTGFTAVQQDGTVTLYLFGQNFAGTSTVATAESTSSSVASGTSTAFVPSPSGGFRGYAITQAEFQYCHGAAYLFNPGQPSMSYLGLVMDHGKRVLSRTDNRQSDELAH